MINTFKKLTHMKNTIKDLKTFFKDQVGEKPMQNVVVYRTSGSPSCWSDWRLSQFSSCEEQEDDFYQDCINRLGYPDEWVDSNRWYPDIETEVWTLHEFEEYEESLY